MAFRKKGGQGTKPRPNGAKPSLAQLGLLEMPDLTGLEDGMPLSDDDDESLEAELHALLSGKAPPRVAKKPKPAFDIETIGKMAAECVKDFDDDLSDENLSGDEELMAELHGISRDVPKSQSLSAMIPPLVPARPTQTQPPSVPPKPQVSTPTHTPAIVKPQAPLPPQGEKNEMSMVEMLSERLNRYKEAEAASRALGESSKARRFSRGIKTLETLIREEKAGKPISEENIPPPVSVPKRTAPQPEGMTLLQEEPRVETEKIGPPHDESEQMTSAESPAAPVAPKRTSSVSRVTKPAGDLTHEKLCHRRDQYKVAALTAKTSGDMETAKNFVRISKQFQTVIDALESGQPVDLSNMPPPPPQEAGRQTASAPPQRPAATVVTAPQEAQIQLPPEADEPEDPNLFNAPPPPSTILEALEQRLEKFRSTQKAAIAENNDSKARRLNRIIKQYETALKEFKAGKTVAFDELPAPPGFGPIPVPQNVPAGPAAMQPDPKPKTIPGRSAPPAPQQRTPSTNVQQPSTTSTPPKPQFSKKLSNRSPSSLLDKQLSFLLERQKLFRAAALESKQNGDIQQAKEYLRKAKGFDPMIEATKSGLPIDATTIPTPPQLQEDYVIVEATECHPDDMDKEENFRSLERDLARQMDICLRNKEHFLKLGDVSSASKFEKFCQETRRDLLVVQSLWKKGEQLPKFHYETRLFSMVQCHSELADNDLKVIVVRGINLPGKSTELDSYVKIEFPFPTETPQHAKTHTVKDTNNPEYNESFKFEMNRKSRTLARVFKRHALKLEVWSKGGFLRSDMALGTASIKLIDLEKSCTIHDSFDLMDGRKACGGKLEVEVTIREPLLAKQIEEVKEKWLVIGS